MGTLLKTNGQFRLYLVYQIFSGLGGGIFSLFMLLSVHLIYGNAMYTGIAGFLMSAPFIFSFAVGPVVDRSNKVRIMRLTTLLEFGLLALLTFTPLLENLGVMFMFAIIFIYALAALFEGPSGTALLPHIVKEDEILQANSLISIASLTGGILLAVLLFGVLAEGENIQLIYGLSTGFLAGAFMFALFLRDPSTKAMPADKPKHRYLPDLIAGTKFLRKNVLLFFLIAIVTRVFFAEISYINMPAFVEYHAGAQGYIVVAVVGMAGSIIASSLVGTLGKKFKVGQMIFAFYIFAGVARIFFALVLPESFNASLGIVVVFATFINAAGIVYRTLEQKIPPKDMVGRIDTMTTTFISISVALGALVGGFIGRMVPDIAHIFIAQGAIIILTGIYIILVPAIRRLPKMNDITREGEGSDQESGSAAFSPTGSSETAEQFPSI